MPTQRNGLLDTLLRRAADGDQAAVRSILEAQPELVNAAGPHPFWGGQPTALIMAAEWGRTEVVQHLLSAGADPNASAATYDGWTPLLCAISKGHREIVSLLIDARATVDIWAAAAIGDEPTVRSHLEADPGLANASGPNRATPLHFATNPAVARTLVEAGAATDVLDQYGSTPLRTCAYRGPAGRAVARYLDSAGSRADIFILAAMGEAAAVDALVDREPALLEARDVTVGPASARGSTPLHIAAALGELTIARSLLDRGVDPDILSTEGHSPLHHAARNGHIRMIRLLLERGATHDMLDSQHRATPADWAGFFGQSEAESMLNGWSKEAQHGP